MTVSQFASPDAESDDSLTSREHKEPKSHDLRTVNPHALDALVASEDPLEPSEQ